MTRATMGIVLVMTTWVSACDGLLETADDAIGQPIGSRTSIGLAIEIDNGVAAPLQVKRGQTFYLNQIDLRASTTATVDEGVSGLRTRGDFADLAWGNVDREEEEFVLLPNADGTFTRRAFFRGAAWMKAAASSASSRSTRAATPSAGRSPSTPASTTIAAHSDDFFDRRFRAIQWTRDCRHAAPTARARRRFEEEALVELRNAMHPEQTFTIDPRTTALRLHWSVRPGRPYTIPLTQVASPRVQLWLLDRRRRRHAAAAPTAATRRAPTSPSASRSGTAPASAFTRGRAPLV